MNYTLNNKHYHQFIDKCEYWKHLLCVQYDLCYLWTSDRSVDARVSYKIEDHMANIYLGKVWGIEPSTRNINRVALHEICHLLLSPLIDMLDKYYSDILTIPIEHSIVTSLENLIKE